LFLSLLLWFCLWVAVFVCPGWVCVSDPGLQAAARGT
jgi:hypothetical protein